MGSHDNLLIRVFSQEISRKQIRSKLRLAHAWSDVDNDTVFPPGQYVFEHPGDCAVVSPFLEPRVHMVRKPQQGCLRYLLRQALLTFLKLLK